MRTLTIKNFSCIKAGSIKLGPLTLIIGPQASGKSVISKLTYFCTKILSETAPAIAFERLTLSEFKKKLANEFCEYFPPSAWGDKKFTINFETPAYELLITRIGKSEKIRISFDAPFEQFYSDTLESYIKNDSLVAKSDFLEFDESYETANLIHEKISTRLKIKNRSTQIFIPAGRSFFTSIDKAVAAFENSSILDPVTRAFGRQYTNLRERLVERSNETSNQLVRRLYKEILGGSIQEANGNLHMESNDGRIIPLSVLSSGQQELLPLALYLSALLPSEKLTRPTSISLDRCIYIEEPEAHLFPQAQNGIVELLGSLVNKRKAAHLLITTHSPYVLSKFNNLIKAGQLNKSKQDHHVLDLIIPALYWIPPFTASAYALIDGQIKDILDEDGLINADYLDNVSLDISKEFSQLLAHEYQYD